MTPQQQQDINRTIATLIARLREIRREREREQRPQPQRVVEVE